MQHNDDQRKLMGQVLAVAVSLFPIGILFGIVAQQSHWTWSEVLLLSVLGFSASGQFFYVKLASEQINFISVFFVILMLNIRYVPMSLAAWNPADNQQWGLRAMLSHFISDESFAIEPKKGRLSLRVRVRAIIYATWILSTVFGVIAGKHIPAGWMASVSQYLLFPATAILAILAVKRLDQFITHHVQFAMPAKLMLISGCAGFSATAMYLVGKDLFWIPGILGVIAILYAFEWGKER